MAVLANSGADTLRHVDAIIERRSGPTVRQMVMVIAPK
jgi:hypothetical protein